MRKCRLTHSGLFPDTRGRRGTALSAGCAGHSPEVACRPACRATEGAPRVRVRGVWAVPLPCMVRSPSWEGCQGRDLCHGAGQGDRGSPATVGLGVLKPVLEGRVCIKHSLPPGRGGSLALEVPGPGLFTSVPGCCWAAEGRMWVPVSPALCTPSQAAPSTTPRSPWTLRPSSFCLAFPLLVGTE